MPWKECSVMDERLQFVARRLDGEPMAELCREFGISRKTGYKIFDRYQECGVEGLTERSRRPYRSANKLPFQVENYILNVKREHRTTMDHRLNQEPGRSGRRGILDSPVIDRRVGARRHLGRVT